MYVLCVHGILTGTYRILSPERLPLHNRSLPFVTLRWAQRDRKKRRERMKKWAEQEEKGGCLVNG
jgi:hypothetical protein